MPSLTTMSPLVYPDQIHQINPAQRIDFGKSAVRRNRRRCHGCAQWGAGGRFVSKRSSLHLPLKIGLRAELKMWPSSSD